MPPTYRAGMTLQDRCRVCKEVRSHTIVVVDGAGTPLRVICNFCQSQHNFRGGETVVAGRPAPRPTEAARVRVEDEELITRGAPTGADPQEVDLMELERLLRQILREEGGFDGEAPADRWRGGELVLLPGKPGTKEYRMPIDTFFRKLVSVRNKLRVLEQQITVDDSLPDELKLKLQGYLTQAYGSLTSFNVLFAAEDDKFKGSGT